MRTTRGMTCFPHGDPEMRKAKAKTKGYEAAFHRGKTDPIVEAWVHTMRQAVRSQEGSFTKEPSMADGNTETKHKKRISLRRRDLRGNLLIDLKASVIFFLIAKPS